MVRAEGRLSMLFPFQPEYCVCEWLTRRGTWWEGVVTTLTSEWYGVWCGVERGRGLRWGIWGWEGWLVVVLPPWWWWRRGSTGSRGGHEAEGGQHGSGGGGRWTVVGQVSEYYNLSCSAQGAW